jgi:hypothetical protein
MNTRKRLLALLVLGAALASCDIEPIDPSEIVTLRGVVLDEAGRPVPGATISTSPATTTTTTDATGAYALTPVPGGYYSLRASAPGYLTTVLLNVAATSTRLPDTLRLKGIQLVAHYPLDGSAVDASGNGRHGVAFGTVSTSDRFGRLDGALLFDGVSSRITVPNGSDMSFAGGSDFTIAAWVRFSGVQSQRPGIVAKGTGGASLRGYELRINGGVGEAELGSSQGSMTAKDFQFLNDNRWHMIGFVAMRSEGRIDMYVDGNRVNFSGGPIGDVSSAADLVIGRGAVTGASFSGAIDDVRLFARGLGIDEFRELYHERGFD